MNFLQPERVEVPYWSKETTRILNLPRQVQNPDPSFVTDLFRSSPGSCKNRKCELCKGTGLMTLKPIQAAMLYQLSLARGLFGPVAAGGGKTLVTFLAPTVFMAERAVLFTKADLKRKTQDELLEYWWHWAWPKDINGPNPKALTPLPTEGNKVWVNPNTKMFYQFIDGVPVGVTRSAKASKYGTEIFEEWVKYNPIIHATPEGTVRQPGFRTFRIESYDILSRADKKSGKLAFDLDQYKPDMLIFDEAHCLKDPDSARTKRVTRYMEMYPDTIVLALSGTLTTRSIFDYAHLAKWALGVDRVPIPTTHHDLMAWASVLDPSKTGTPSRKEWELIEPIREKFALPEDYESADCASEFFSDTPYAKTVEVTRKAFRRNLATAIGVASTSLAMTEIGLVMHKVEVDVPSPVQEAIDFVNLEWKTPDNEEEFSEAPIKAACTRHLGAGFWYKQIRPKGLSDEAWSTYKGYRRAWHHELREVLKDSLKGADSPMLLARHCKRALGETVDAEFQYVPDYDSEEWDNEQDYTEETKQDIVTFVPPIPLLVAYENWCKVKNLEVPPSEPVWVSKFLINKVQELIDGELKGKNVIVWYQHRAVEEALSNLKVDGQRMRVYGKGKQPPKNPITCGMSIRCQGTGKNLQKWAHNILLELPPNGTTLEQLIARTHRERQEAKDVHIYYFNHVQPYIDALQQAMDDAKYQSETMGPQRILNAEWM